MTASSNDYFDELFGNYETSSGEVNFRMEAVDETRFQATSLCEVSGFEADEPISEEHSASENSSSPRTGSKKRQRLFNKESKWLIVQKTSTKSYPYCGK